MIKNILIFLIQTLVVSLTTVFIGSEAYLYYKQDVEKPVKCPSCPSLSCPEQYQEEVEYAGDMLACIDNDLYLIRDNETILKDSDGEHVLCSKGNSIESLGGYKLWKRVHGYNE